MDGDKSDQPCECVRTQRTTSHSYEVTAADVAQGAVRDKLPVTVVQPGEIKCSMNDVGGYQEAKLEVIEYINFIRNQEHYEKLGAWMVKGALLIGPPGMGKTLLACATAGEAGILFITCSSSSLLLSSDGPEKMREIFKFAYEKAPCMLFFDEIDCIARSCDHELAKPETQCLTEELLVQFDSFEQHANKTLIILASTNRQCDIDCALLHPRQFDRMIEMPKPDIEARMAILNIHLKPLLTDIDKMYLAKQIAVLTDNFSRAQIASMCNKSAMIATRGMNDQVTMAHLEVALDRVWSGMKRRKPLSDEQKLRYACHNAAHDVASWFLQGTKPPTKVRG